MSITCNSDKLHSRYSFDIKMGRAERSLIKNGTLRINENFFKYLAH